MYTYELQLHVHVPAWMSLRAGCWLISVAEFEFASLIFSYCNYRYIPELLNLPSHSSKSKEDLSHLTFMREINTNIFNIPA